jgi:uncharacterized membrane protein YdcZ (DUF606 family)
MVMLFLVVAGALLLSSRDAFAYLDPGTGNMLLQSVIATIAGSLLVIKVYWRRFVDFCKRKSSARSNLNDDRKDEAGT